MASSLHIRNNSNSKRRRLVSEINITPMVDVMLVLLIIFMVTSPMLVAGVNVDLPQTNSAPIASDTSDPLTVTITQQEEIFVLETKIAPEMLINKLQEISKANKDLRIFVRGDKNLSYGKVVEVMAKIHNAGFTKVALVSDIQI